MQMHTSKIVLPWLALVAAASCGNSRSDRYFPELSEPDTFCRESPADCAGEIGGRCAVTADCDDGVCCREDKNCDGGMCLYLCSGNADCPSNMRCEHGHCFFSCSTDSQCGAGQSCEHGKTICEYED